MTFFELVAILKKVSNYFHTVIMSRATGGTVAMPEDTEGTELQNTCREHEISISLFVERRFPPQTNPDVLRWSAVPCWSGPDGTTAANIIFVVTCNARGEIATISTMVEITKMPEDMRDTTAPPTETPQESPEGMVGSAEETQKFLKEMGLDDLQNWGT